jgi:hypothetical protein
MIRGLLIIALSLAAAGAQAQGHTLKPLERSYELELADIVLPGSIAGSVIVTPCEECDAATHRVSAATIYVLNGQPVTFEEFIDTAQSRRNVREITSAGVYIDLESERVNRILLFYAAD